MWGKNISPFPRLFLLPVLLWAVPPAWLPGEEEYRITRSELERILQISGNLEAASLQLGGTRESLGNASREIKSWSISFSPGLTALGQSLAASTGRAGSLEASAISSAQTARNLEKSILTYSQDLYKMEKSRNFWRKAALIGVPAAAGACFLAGMLLGRQRPI